MQPQHIERLEALPKTPNGKIDRKALPRPSAAALRGVRTQADDLADPRQAYLAAIWRELIGVERVGADDTFFDVGGHSLLAVEMVARVQRETSVRLHLLDVASGTLAMLASELPEPSAAAAPDSLLRRLRQRLGWSRWRARRSTRGRAHDRAGHPGLRRVGAGPGARLRGLPAVGARAGALAR